MKSFKKILAVLSLLISLQAFAAQAPIPYPTQSPTLSGMPTELKIVITQLLTNFKKYDDAINAINALYQTDKKFRTIIETTNPEWLINTLANNYPCIAPEEIAKDLKITSIKNLLKSKEDNWLKTIISQDNKARNAFYYSRLGDAISTDDFEAVRVLVSVLGHDFKYAGDKIAMRAFGSNPPIAWTIQTIKFFMEKGLKPECLRSALVNYAGTATTSYNSKNLDLEIVKLLVNHGVDINSKDINKETALISATRNGAAWGTPATLATVTYLLENGANPNIKDGTSKTALDWAVLKNQANIFPILQRYGAKRSYEIQ